jgi:hypothetical protein
MKINKQQFKNTVIYWKNTQIQRQQDKDHCVFHHFHLTNNFKGKEFYSKIKFQEFSEVSEI